MVIYKATNKINGKEYIGQTITTLESRKRTHIWESLNNRCTGYFHKAIRKYGPNNFDWEILHTNINNIGDLNKLEIFYIGYYNTFNSGYNLNLGGGGNFGYKNKWGHHTEESKQKMSESRKGIVNKGKYNGQARPVIINNKYFDTVVAASKFLCINESSVRWRINYKTKWLDYHYG